MPSVVTAINAAGRNGTIDYNAGQACDVVIKVFTCIVRNMFATVLTTITRLFSNRCFLSNFSMSLKYNDCTFFSFRKNICT